MNALKYFGLGLLAILALGAGLIFTNIVGTVTSVATAPGRVLTKTLETNNIISNYEWYFDAKAEIDSRISQIATHRQILADTSQPAEMSRLRMELAAMQQSCRTLTNRYNANSAKLNDGLFRDWRLPQTLDVAPCENPA